ncbi:MAG: transposase [Halothiobacillus sp.]
MGSRSVYDQEKKFSPEFKNEAVALTRQPGMSCRQVALDIGINPNMQSRWGREAGEGLGKVFVGTGSPWDQEVARLKRELVQIKKERDFSRDAAAYFAKGSSSGPG